MADTPKNPIELPYFPLTHHKVRYVIWVTDKIVVILFSVRFVLAFPKLQNLHNR